MAEVKHYKYSLVDLPFLSLQEAVVQKVCVTNSFTKYSGEKKPTFYSMKIDDKNKCSCKSINEIVVNEY